MYKMDLSKNIKRYKVCARNNKLRWSEDIVAGKLYVMDADTFIISEWDMEHSITLSNLAEEYDIKAMKNHFSAFQSFGESYPFHIIHYKNFGKSNSYPKLRLVVINGHKFYVQNQYIKEFLKNGYSIKLVEKPGFHYFEVKDLTTGEVVAIIGGVKV